MGGEESLEGWSGVGGREKNAGTMSDCDECTVKVVLNVVRVEVRECVG